jgi:hypothetical protein
MKYLMFLAVLSLAACSEIEKPPLDQKNAPPTPDNLKFPPDFYARPAKGEKAKMELPKESVGR